MPPYSYCAVSFMNWMSDPLHKPGEDHCCRDYTALTDLCVIYAFDHEADAALFKLKNHMKGVMWFEDRDGSFKTDIDELRSLTLAWEALGKRRTIAGDKVIEGVKGIMGCLPPED